MMKVEWDPLSNLCMLNLTQTNNLMTEFHTPDKYFAGSVYEWKSKVTLVNYHRTSCWIPTQSGWVKAISKHFFTSWPGLSPELVQKHLTKKKSTILGHLQKTRKCLRSTQKKELQPEPEPDPEPELDQFPPYAQTEGTNIVFLKTVDMTGKIYTVQKGRFPITSSRGNKYILVDFHYDSNTIHAEPLKTRKGIELKK